MLYSTQLTLDYLGIVLVTAHINDYEFNFVVDTGSTTNIIFESAYKEHANIFEKSDKMKIIYGIDGIRQQCPDVFADLVFDDMVIKTKFHVVNASKAVANFLKNNNIQLHGMLGVQFLKDNNCVIDFANKTIKIGE